MEPKVLIRRNPSLRNHMSWIVWPMLAIPALIYLMYHFWAPPWWAGLIIAFVCLLLPFSAWIRSKNSTYVVTDTTVYMRKGILSKYINEIRIADIRGVTVQQGLFQRLMSVGQVGFSSAAGGGEEVTFIGISDPDGVKRLVQRRMTDIKGNADDGE